MTWICAEGLDRTGKSTVAKLYEEKGFKIVHMSAPNKKYQDEFYTGPSYLDEIMDLLLEYDGKDVIFDRTWHGERIWPYVYNRKQCLTDEDFELIKEFEDRNDTQRILMIDPDAQAHWQRCVDNKEPLTKNQFDSASIMFGRLAHSENFVIKTLGDFVEEPTGTESTGSSDEPEESAPTTNNEGQMESNSVVTPIMDSKKSNTYSDIEQKLEKANIIKGVLSKRLIKAKTPFHDQVENEIKQFLTNRLSELMGDNAVDHFTNTEVKMLKTLCNQLQSKLGGKS